MTLSRLKVSPEWKQKFDRANAKLLCKHFTQFSVNSMQIVSTCNNEYSYVLDVVIFLTDYSKIYGNHFMHYVVLVHWIYWREKDIFEACSPTIYQYYTHTDNFIYEE